MALTRPNATRGKAIAAAMSLALATPHSVSFITGWEGNVRNTYLDIVGVPTVCAGITDPDVAIPGASYTELECRELNTKEIEHYAALTASCITTRISQREFDSYVSLSYNIGPQAFCASTLVKRLNDGDRDEACNQVLRWNRAGGRVVRGLDNRRKDENRQCITAARATPHLGQTVKIADVSRLHEWHALSLLRPIDVTPVRLHRLMELRKAP